MLEICFKGKILHRTKHIAIPHHFFCYKVRNLEIRVEGIDTTDQIADQFTKGLSQDKFEMARYNLMGWRFSTTIFIVIFTNGRKVVWI